MTTQDPVASYMLVAFRPYYASRLISEVVRKTTVPYEFLIWLNCESPFLEEYIASLASSGAPIRIVGKTPENIGMAAFGNVIAQARGRILVQVEDDVLLISRHGVEVVEDVFQRYPAVQMVGAHVWQDEYTTGARPPVKLYNPMVPAEGLYEGPIDGGFTFYRRELAEAMMDQPMRKYFGLGVGTHLKLIRAGERQKGWLSLKIRMFHVHGPIYHSCFPGMLDFEISKYRSIQYMDIAQVYEDAKSSLPPAEVLQSRLKEIQELFETFDFRDMPRMTRQLMDLAQRLPPEDPRPAGSRIEHAGRRGWWHYVR